MKEKEQQTQKSKIESTSPTPSSDMILFFEPLEINMSNLSNLSENRNVQLDENEFMRGLKDVSHVCGMYTGLINSGFSIDDAIEVVIGKLNIEHSLEVAKINANASIECSKNALMIKEKDML